MTKTFASFDRNGNPTRVSIPTDESKTELLARLQRVAAGTPRPADDFCDGCGAEKLDWRDDFCPACVAGL